MATPNFVFTDPVAASQLVGLAQIAAAEEAARNQAMLGTLQALGSQRTARENSAAERYRYESQAALQRDQMRMQAQEAEKNRMARSGEVDRTIAANKDMTKMETDARIGAGRQARQDAADIEDYNFVLSRVQGDDPPTDDEFAALSLNLSPERAKRLDGVRRQNISALTQAADNAEALASYWNSRIAKLGANNTTGENLDTIIAEATKSQAGKFIIFDPGSGLFRSVVRRPRAALVAAPPPVDRIQDLIGRVQLQNPAIPPVGAGAAALGVRQAPLPVAPPPGMPRYQGSLRPVDWR